MLPRPLPSRQCLDVALELCSRPAEAVRVVSRHSRLWERPRTTRRCIRGVATKLTSARLQFQDFFTKKQEPREAVDTGRSVYSRLLTRDRFPEISLTKSDTAFLEEGIEFVEGHEGIDLTDLNDLFSKVRFPRRDPARLQKALENTYFVLWIRYVRPSTRYVKQGQILGFARVLSDGVYYSSLWDVAVVPAWQRGGLGRALVERILVKLRHDGIPIVSLYAERGVVGLYEKLGFRSEPGGLTGMAYALKT